MHASLPTPNLPTEIIPTKIPRLKLSGEFPADMRIPPLEIKILLESNPLKSRIFVRRLAVHTVPAPLSANRSLAPPIAISCIRLHHSNSTTRLCVCACVCVCV